MHRSTVLICGLFLSVLMVVLLASCVSGPGLEAAAPATAANACTAYQVAKAAFVSYQYQHPMEPQTATMANDTIAVVDPLCVPPISGDPTVILPKVIAALGTLNAIMAPPAGPAPAIVPPTIVTPLPPNPVPAPQEKPEVRS